MAERTRFLVLPADADFELREVEEGKSRSLLKSGGVLGGGGGETQFKCPDIAIGECGSSLVVCVGMTG